MASTIHSSIKPDAFLPATHSSSFFLSPVDSAQVELALSGLDRHKATIDITNYLIKIASNLLSTPLTNLFNESIESGIVRDIFKISKVTPVFKTGAVTDPGNYRPIAVLSLFDKILERLVYNQLSTTEIIQIREPWCPSAVVYLESRTQYPLSIQCGVPQGSTIGPLLFLIYINDMPNCLEKGNIRTFADDTTLFHSSNSLQDLEKTINEEFNHLLSYCSANKLSVNFKKTHYMTISSPQKANKLKLNLRNIEETNYIKYLGIYSLR